MEIRTITFENVGDPQLRDLYKSSFPEQEQIPFDELKLLLKSDLLDFSAYYDEGMFIGFTIVLKMKEYNWGWYFAVRDELRGRGYGQQILSALIERYANSPLVIDIESPHQECDNKEQRKRRYEFYKRNGFKDTPTLKSFEGLDFTILLLGEVEFSQSDYDSILQNLSRLRESVKQEYSGTDRS